MDALVTSLAVLVGAVVGVTVERLRSQHELALRRRDDIKAGCVAIYREANSVLGASTVLYGFGGTANPSVIADRRLAINEHAERLLEAWWAIELLLPKRSQAGASVGAWCTALSGPWPAKDAGTAERKAANEETYQRIRRAHEALKQSLRAELHRLV